MVKKLSKENVLSRIKNSETAIISMNNGVMTTRRVSVSLYDNKIWFQTDLRSKKMKGLNCFDECECSLLIDNLNIDGAVLKTKGHPLDKRNSEWLKVFEKQHPNTAKNYSEINTEVLCCVDIKDINEIRMWEYDENHKPFIHSIQNIESDEWEDIILCGYTYGTDS